jgi:TatA/E family protein of Tat protein translocase
MMNTLIFGFFNLGFGELFAIFVVVLLLFGADKIPEFAKSLGKGIRYVKDATDSVKRDIQSSVDEVKVDIDANVKEVKEGLDVANSVKRDAKVSLSKVMEEINETVDQKNDEITDSLQNSKPQKEV